MRKQRLAIILAIFAGLVLHGTPISLSPDRAEAAQTTTKKSTTKKSSKKSGAQKKSYCGYPAPPLPVGMSDYCARQYDLYCRRGVGCNQFGR